MQYAVGIDLGTTHCVMAASPLSRPNVELVRIPQLVAAGEVAERELLPSFLYLPFEGELPEYMVGEWARRLGAQSPTRLVASAKSWICHGGVNRRAAILPWAAPDNEVHISPFEASVRYLEHLRTAWERHHPPLAEQDVVVTVPASFDEAARELTVDAAREAGLGSVRLIEEPQAAFYDFRASGQSLGDAKLVLVVDVGGGTTDLTLLKVLPDGELERIAVGGHLMLGGDNMDAALAHHALGLAPKQQLDPTEWSTLVQAARNAKELLLGEAAPDEITLTQQARGARLIGSSWHVRVRRDEVRKLLLDGFFPMTARDEVATRAGRAGLTTMGLPYTSDTAVPRHICTFLRKHVRAAEEAGARIFAGLPRPDRLLLNGGVFNGRALVERLSQVLAHWYDGEPVPLLEHTSLDTAVARGAVRFALTKHGIGAVIRGGTARAYYLAVDGERPRALCVVPRGLDEGKSVTLPAQVFRLVLDKRVTFPLYAYTGDRVDAPGTLVDITDELDP
jgi:hypothetical protein